MMLLYSIVGNYGVCDRDGVGDAVASVWLIADASVWLIADASVRLIDDAPLCLIADAPCVADSRCDQDATNMELHKKDNDASCSHFTLHDKQPSAHPYRHKTLSPSLLLTHVRTCG